MAIFFGRLVAWWKLFLGVLLAALPVIAYVFGRKEGKKIETVEVLKEQARTEEERADFYKEMEQASHEVQDNRPANRDELVKRLRKQGL